jgi:hypothetical protein
MVHELWSFALTPEVQNIILKTRKLKNLILIAAIQYEILFDRRAGKIVKLFTKSIVHVIPSPSLPKWPKLTVLRCISCAIKCGIHPHIHFSWFQNSPMAKQGINGGETFSFQDLGLVIKAAVTSAIRML